MSTCRETLKHSDAVGKTAAGTNNKVQLLKTKSWEIHLGYARFYLRLAQKTAVKMACVDLAHYYNNTTAEPNGCYNSLSVKWAIRSPFT